MSWKRYMQGYRAGYYSHPLHLAWKVLWIVPVYAAITITAVLICVGWGYERARRFVHENI